MVITKADADAALYFHKSRGNKPNYITSGMFDNYKLKDVSMPTDMERCALYSATNSAP